MGKTFRPFSNAIEFMVWSENNCEHCKKANMEATEREDTCPMEYDITIAAINDGLIPIESAERIGFKTEPYTHLLECKEKQATE
jgi:hypothetical protein